MFLLTNPVSNIGFGLKIFIVLTNKLNNKTWNFEQTT